MAILSVGIGSSRKRRNPSVDEAPQPHASMAGSNRNPWRDHSGLGGGIKSERVAASIRNEWRDHSGICIQKADFPAAVHKILMAAFKNALATRRDGLFVPLLQVEYSDSVPMVTVGGALLADGQAFAIRTKVAKDLPFLETKATLLYAIEDFHLTERERALFDMAATKQRRGSPEQNALKKLGFKDRDVDSYRELIRYIPRYVETIV
jgi:hypothetical protein